ncbi:MAG: hypothetical protein H6587_08195 [Flavobacteriales bacterium]|nr:hypothetical protein [Flavobacteriales bacterium]MCB9364534.1 hypothetical protein [Flavobacteriales bacterium]
MTRKIVKEELLCSSCGTKQHKWHEVYYEEGSKLIKAEKSYITWCNKIKGYVIENTNKEDEYI